MVVQGGKLKSKNSPKTGGSVPPQVTPDTSQVSRTCPPSETQKQLPDTADSNQPQQAGATPEAAWKRFIYEVYPNLLKETYFLPPFHFNRTPQVVATIAGQTVSVRDNPSPQPRRRWKKPSHPPPAQVAGTVFVENPCDLQDARIQHSDQQDDRAQQRCLQALSNVPNQVMIVISSLIFQKYLKNNAVHAAIIAQLPSIQHPSIPQPVADGECDIVVIHRQYGLIVGEIKSVGESSSFHSHSRGPGDQTQLIVKRIEKALKQLNNQETALRHLVSDLPPIRITKTLLLPNISSGQLQSALLAFPLLLENLCQSLAVPIDASLAVGHCLCEQDIGHPLTWWQTLTTAGPDPVMTDDLYERLVARFCGPATTVDVPTTGPSYKVVKSWGQAVAETGLRFSTLTLTPAQATVLNRQPQPQWMHLEGPPGTGKTVLLLLKALQWVRQGGKVCILSGNKCSRAVTLLLKEQLHSIVGPAATTSIQRLCYDFSVSSDYGYSSDFDARAAVSSLQQQLLPGRNLVIFDEADYFRDEFVLWLKEVRAQLPYVSVWSASCGSLHLDRTHPILRWLKLQTMREVLRCPPTVATQVQQASDVKRHAILPYRNPWPHHLPPTQGPPVQKLQHKYRQPGHSGDYPWQCVTCSDYVADVISQLRVGQPGHPLQYRDVWILYDYEAPHASQVMIQWLQQHHGLPVGVVSSYPPSKDVERELALAIHDQVMAVKWSSVVGLERRVVIVLGEIGIDNTKFLPMSRCSSSLHLIA